MGDISRIVPMFCARCIWGGVLPSEFPCIECEWQGNPDEPPTTWWNKHRVEGIDAYRQAEGSE